MGFADTIVALATPPGDGAIGIIRLSGSGALELLERLSLRRRPVEPRRMTLTQLRDPETRSHVDEVMVCCMPAPHSYTGEDVVEIYGHGGGLNMEQLVLLFTRAGARLAEPGEFTRRAFVNGKLDLTQAEGVAEVIAARSVRALRNAQALRDGELGRRVRALRKRAVQLGADLEACLDFADDLETPVPREAVVTQHRELIAGLERLVQSYAQGRRLNGISVALVGRVNAGKSSLLNALHGRRRALVSQEEGTTRDYLEVELGWDGQAITLVDTAGARQGDAMSPIEAAGHALGSERVALCDAVVRVVDVAAQEEASTDAQSREERVTLVAAHKADLLEEAALQSRCRALARRFGCPVVATSAKTERGLEALRREVLRGVVPLGQASEQRETVQVTQARQHEALCRALGATRAGLEAHERNLPPELVVEHTREALEALGEITGETYTEDVLDSVFSRFCIGK